MSDRSVLERLRADGPGATLDDGGHDSVGARELVSSIRAAVGARGEPRVELEAWDTAGRRHSPATLDEALGTVAPALGVPLLSGLRKRRLRESALRVLDVTCFVGTVQLLLAVLGATGRGYDAERIEEFALHPALALHAVTALASMSAWEGRAALLRLLSRTDGAERVVVIDRLLAFVREPVVRLALVREGFVGLADEHAREIAPAVVDALGLADWLTEERTPEDLRERARVIIALTTDA